MNEKETNKSLNYLLLISGLRSLSLTLPLIMIGLYFKLDFPIFLTLVTAISTISSSTILIPSETFVVIFEWLYNIFIRPFLYIFALIVTIQGEQDIVAIIFYIIAGLQAFNIIKWFLYYIINLVSILKK